MAFVATGANQNVWLLRLGDMAKGHGRNLLSANIAMLVIPSARLNGKAAGIICATLEWNENPVSSLNRIPPASASTALHLCNHRVGFGSLGSKCGKRVASWNPALHPQILRKFR